VKTTIRSFGERSARIVLATLLLGTVGFSLAGCSEKTDMTKAEQENFKGGPMPAGFLDKQGSAPPANGPGASPATGGTPAAPPAAAPK
jgi:hypothetical protein